MKFLNFIKQNDLYSLLRQFQIWNGLPIFVLVRRKNKGEPWKLYLSIIPASMVENDSKHFYQVLETKLSGKTTVRVTIPHRSPNCRICSTQPRRIQTIMWHYLTDHNCFNPEKERKMALPEGSFPSTMGDLDFGQEVTLNEKLKVFKSSEFDPENYVSTKCRTTSEKVYIS